MNLVLDFGNTRIKAGFFIEDRMVKVRSYFRVEELLADEDVQSKWSHCIVCSVTGEHETFLEAAKQRPVILFGADTPVPLSNMYKSASTLGSDRLAAAAGAFSLYPGKDVLSVDAGTCIKYNFVNSKNEFIGGAISPGIAMRLKSLHQQTSRLPFINADFAYEKLTGQSTEESILSGVLIGAAAELDGMVARYREQFPGLVTVITGGDHAYLCRQVKNRIFAVPQLVLMGLNAILQFNLDKNSQ